MVAGGVRVCGHAVISGSGASSPSDWRDHSRDAAAHAGFNVLLANEPRSARFWSWFVAGNLHVLPRSTCCRLRAVVVIPLFA